MHNLLAKKTSKNSPAGKRTCLLPCLACDVDSVLSFEQNWNKKLVVAAFRLWRENGKMSAQDIGPLVQHRFDRQVKQEKRLIVALYLDE